MIETTKKPAARKPRKAKEPDHDALRGILAIAEGYAPTQFAALLDRLVDECDAKVADKGNYTLLSLAGLRVQSTAGPVNALANWLNKARRIVRGVA